MKELAGYTILDFYRLDLDPEFFRAKKAILSTTDWNKFIFGLSGIIDKLQHGYLNKLNEKKIRPREGELAYLVDEVLANYRPRKNEKHNFEPRRKQEALIIELCDDSGCYSLKGDFGEFLKKEFEARINVHQYASAISLFCDGKESARILETFSKSSFSANAASYTKRVKRARRSNIFRLPEPFRPIRNIKKTEGLDWNLEDIQAYEAQEVTRGEKSLIGVIDTGVDYTHDELKERFGKDKGYDFVEDKEDPYDLNGHGTHVAGTVAGKKVGIANECTLLAYRVLDEDGSGSEADVIAAIEMAIDDNVDAINMSLGSPATSLPLQQVCSEAYKRGIFVAAAAGNDGNSHYNYPASLDGVVSVAATTRNRKKAYFSNSNDMVDIAAPGVDIYSSLPDNDYGIFSGTSMATPHITALAALGKSLKKIEAKELEGLLKVSGINIDDKDLSGYEIKLAQAYNLVKDLK
jgi:hypothetical protein